LLQQLGGFDYAFPQGRIETQYTIVDDFSKSVGNHELKIGMNFRRSLVSEITMPTAKQEFESRQEIVNSSGLSNVAYR
jgi:hypothetical protein